MAGKPKDITGQRFGRLIALCVTPNRTQGNVAKWLFRCDCGKEIELSGASARSGKTQSCGCLQKDRVRRWNFANTGRSHRLNRLETDLENGIDGEDYE